MRQIRQITPPGHAARGMDGGIAQASVITVRTAARAGPSPRSADFNVSGVLDEKPRKGRPRNAGRLVGVQPGLGGGNVDREVDAAGRRPAPHRRRPAPRRGSRRFWHLARAVVALVVLCVAPVGQICGQQAPADNPEARSLRRLVQDASRALQAGNAASFLRWFDRGRFAGYPALESHVVALTTQSDIASSVQIVAIEPAEGGYRLRVDWLLQLSVKETPGPLETRREALKISAEAEKGKWRISSLEPVEFFRPQGSP